MVSLKLLLPAILAAVVHADYTWNTCKRVNPNTPNCAEVTRDIGVSKIGRAGGRAGGRGSMAKNGAGQAAKAVGEGALGEAGGQAYNQIFGPDQGKSLTKTRFSYQQADGYWYSHDIDGLYVSPAGYWHPNGDMKYLAVWSKNGMNTLWTSAVDCCLPDGVGTGIADVKAYEA